MPEIKIPKPLRCNICWNKFEFDTVDFCCIEENGVCTECYEINYEDIKI